MTMPTDAAARKDLPLASGVLDYFPAALIEISKLSRKGNDQHNPGMRMFWNRAKSGDEADALLRHLVDRGTLDADGIRHSAKVAWRALALLQKELEEEGAPVARGATPPDPEPSARLVEALKRKSPYGPYGAMYSCESSGGCDTQATCAGLAECRKRKYTVRDTI